MQDQKLKLDFQGYMIIAIMIIVPVLIVFNSLRRELAIDEYFWFGLSMFPLFVLLTGFPFMTAEVRNNVLRLRYSVTSFRDADIPLDSVAEYSYSIRFSRLTFYDQEGKKIRSWWYLHRINPVLDHLSKNAKHRITFY